MEGSRYCLDGCVEHALNDSLRRLCSPVRREPCSRRIPLGLLLLSRNVLTEHQLRTALETQRVAGHGRIGEWLQALGFADERQITAGLARQWGCPVLRTNLSSSGFNRAPKIPVSLLKFFQMVPVDFVDSTSSLHLAFSGGIDYGVLYAIERMLECHTEACLATPSMLSRSLQAIPDQRGDSEVVFDRTTDSQEIARIVGNYSVRVSASEIRLAPCGDFVWARLLSTSRAPIDLILRWSASRALANG